MVMGRNTIAYCDLIAAKAAIRDISVQQLCLGLTWTACQTPGAVGFAMSPGKPCRTLPWPGTLAGRYVSNLAPWSGRGTRLKPPPGLLPQML